LKKVTDVSPDNREGREIRSSARLTLSYVYFELADYDAALAELNAIPSDFHDYPEVLLTRGWTSVKLQDYRGALAALNELCQNYQSYYNIEEAYFLRAQCYMKLGYYNFAINEYERVTHPSDSSGFAMTNAAAQQALHTQETRIASLRSELLALESKLVKSIPLRADEHVFDADAEPRSVEVARSEMMRQIVEERREFNRITESIAEMKKRVDKREMRRKWQAYAEYGKVRAMYLRETAAH